MTGMKEGAGEDPFADDEPSQGPESGGSESHDAGIGANDTGTSTPEDGEHAEEERIEKEETENGGDRRDESRAESSEQTRRDDNVSDGQTSDEQQVMEIPYKLRRDSVQDGRNRVPLFLQGETKAAERDTLRELEERFDDDVSLTDLREAMILVGLDHLDEVEEQLGRWGYGMTFDT